MSYRADIEVKVEQILNTHYIDHHGNEYECKKCGKRVYCGDTRASRQEFYEHQAKHNMNLI